MKFYVYSGFVTPDNYDCSEGGGAYRMSTCLSVDEVNAMRLVFEQLLLEHGAEASHPVFRVFEGQELDMEPHTMVAQWRVKRRK